MRRSSVVCAVLLVSALALLVAACGAGGESGEPTTTVQGELVETADEAPVQLDEDGGDEGGEDDEEGAGAERKSKGKGKDQGKGHGNGQGND